MYLEYLVDESLQRTVNNELINPDTGEVNSELTDRTEIALAEVAAVLYKNAPLLSPAQLEQVAAWAKKWKNSKSPHVSNSRRDFSDELEQLRKSSDLKRLQTKSIWKLLGAGIIGIIAAMLMVGLAVGWNEVSWGWKVGLFIVLWFAFGYAHNKMHEALELAHARDRKYALASLRKARSVFELNLAGLFMNMPQTHYQDPGFEGRTAMRKIRAEVERLTDALYNDPDDWLMELEYPWRNAEATEEK